MVKSEGKRRKLGVGRRNHGAMTVRGRSHGADRRGRMRNRVTSVRTVRVQPALFIELSTGQTKDRRRLGSSVWRAAVGMRRPK